ncbi:hypothetical protein KWH78_02915 [Morganella morganii]|uniref:STM4504/CBY_0614 family protein n=1 Tax=Morganella morganii TaxID=582 RepID=UPI0021D2E784|nr:hypothetical protein [Morganella morganii]MCU6210051.1 hypothetical protein [Morganella morganii]
MGIYNLFSKRQKKLRGEICDVYQYDTIPKNLKIQITQIISDAIGTPTPCNRFGHFMSDSDELYAHIHKILCREYGTYELIKNANTDFDEIYNYFLQLDDIEKCLDIIEVSFRTIAETVRENPYKFREITSLSPDDAIDELNERFKESCVGFQFESNEIIRIDSQIIHSEVVKPTLRLLSSTPYLTGSNNEFLSAHEHYRHKRYKECLNDCLKSFESLMKAIHDNNNWVYNKNDTASKLISSCLSHNLIPSYLQSQFTSLRTMLETGVPTIRNKNSGHGQGIEIKNVDEELASYMLHLTATNLLYLAQCAQKIK